MWLDVVWSFWGVITWFGLMWCQGVWCCCVWCGSGACVSRGVVVWCGGCRLVAVVWCRLVLCDLVVNCVVVCVIGVAWYRGCNVV